jgi:endonuclease/exonuclease/phosphatase family metal-dependent hydrolase
MKLALRAALLTAALTLPVSAREFTVVTYNVENLFDADGQAVFDDYQETGKENAYSPAKLLVKLQNIGRVLQTFNQGAGPEVIAFNEFEIDFTPESKATDHAAVLEKYKDVTVEEMLTTKLDDEIRGLPVEVLLLKYLEDEGMGGYQVAVGEDEADLSLLETTDRSVRRKAHKNAVFSKFPITDVKSHATPDARDILETTLDIDGQPLILFVNHWKSRASDLNAEQTRRLNARTLRDRLDAIMAENPSADILVAGDFNSQYNQTKANPHLGKTAVNDVLGSQGDEATTAASTGFSLYNLWHELPPEKRYSDSYDGKWGTLMQKMVTPGLYDHRGVQYVDNSFMVVMVDDVNTVGVLNLPRRWTNFGAGAGTSDHFPIAAKFRTVDEDDTAKRLELSAPGREEDAPTELMEVGFDSLETDDVPAFEPLQGKDPATQIGELFRVRGKITSLRPLAIEVGGEKYLLHSHNKDLRQQLRSYPKEGRLEFIGELGTHRGQLQFVVGDEDWILKEPKPAKD